MPKLNGGIISLQDTIIATFIMNNTSILEQEAALFAEQGGTADDIKFELYSIVQACENAINVLKEVSARAEVAIRKIEATQGKLTAASKTD